MDLEDQLQAIAARIPKQLEQIKTEEATKNAFIMPFINSLGYNVFDPLEVVPEFIADVGLKKGEKVDYVIHHDGKPAILVECKTAGSKLSLENASQLFRYFTVTEARFAILSNGVNYEFYTDIEAPNKMDSKPFFEFSMLSLDSRAIAEIKKFAKAFFNVDAILSNASELKYLKQIKNLVGSEFDSPSEDFVRLFTSRVYTGKFTAAIKEQFTSLVQVACRDFVRDKINERLQSAIDTGAPAVVPKTAEPVVTGVDAEEGEIITTPEEIEGFHIVRAILSSVIEPARVVMRDTKSYCGILLDDNNRKPICRLRFNFSQKYIGLMDPQKNEEKVPLQAITDIYKHTDRLKQTVSLYNSTKLSDNETITQS
jgi:hypothetical protein